MLTAGSLRNRRWIVFFSGICVADTTDFSRARLDRIVDHKLLLLVLRKKLPWEAIEQTWIPYCHLHGQQPNDSFAHNTAHGIPNRHQDAA